MKHYKKKDLNKAIKIIDEVIKQTVGKKCKKFYPLCPICETYRHWEWIKEVLSIYSEGEEIEHEN